MDSTHPSEPHTPHFVTQRQRDLFRSWDLARFFFFQIVTFGLWQSSPDEHSFKVRFGTLSSDMMLKFAIDLMPSLWDMTNQVFEALDQILQPNCTHTKQRDPFSYDSFQDEENKLEKEPTRKEDDEGPEDPEGRDCAFYHGILSPSLLSSIFGLKEMERMLSSFATRIEIVRSVYFPTRWQMQETDYKRRAIWETHMSATASWLNNPPSSPLYLWAQNTQPGVASYVQQLAIGNFEWVNDEAVGRENTATAFVGGADGSIGYPHIGAGNTKDQFGRSERLILLWIALECAFVGADFGLLHPQESLPTIQALFQGSENKEEDPTPFLIPEVKRDLIDMLKYYGEADKYEPTRRQRVDPGCGSVYNAAGAGGGGLRAPDGRWGSFSYNEELDETSEIPPQSKKKKRGFHLSGKSGLWTRLFRGKKTDRAKETGNGTHPYELL